MALIDAPDIDSIVQENRELATALFGAADLWLFVTTGARYADAVPWDLLTRASERHAKVALVVGRLDHGSAAIRDDLSRMLTERGLGAAPIFAIPEHVDAAGMLPAAAVGDLARWLTHLGKDGAARTAAIAATRDGAIDDVVRQTRELAVAARAQSGEAGALSMAVQNTYDRATGDVVAATSDGTLLRGEVLSRWQDFVGTGEFFKALEERIGRARDAVTGFLRGKGKAIPGAQEAIGTSLEAVILDAAARAADQTFRAWHHNPAARRLLPGLELSTPSPGLRADVTEQIRAWQGDVLALVGEQASGKRGTARALSLGVNGLGLTLMIVVFASTGGLTGAEFGIAGGTAVLAQRVLEGVFGDDAVRRLTRTAHEQLAARVRAVLAGEAGRFYSLLDAQDISARAAGELEAAADDVEVAARVERLSRAQYAVPGGTRGTSATTASATTASTTTAGTTTASAVKRVGASDIGGLRGVDVPTPLGWLTPGEDRTEPGESAAGEGLDSDKHVHGEAGEGRGGKRRSRRG